MARRPGDHAHDAASIRDRLAAGARPSYLRDWVYGAIDGAVTTFAIVAGVVGAELSASVVLVLGAANLFADGFSMAAANYTG
ncbi:MAG: VIT1/CCC1 transporter family protein, partial [Alphaproteobacteria bacterium]